MSKDDALKTVEELKEEVRRLKEENDQLKNQLADLRCDITGSGGYQSHNVGRG